MPPASPLNPLPGGLATSETSSTYVSIPAKDGLVCYVRHVPSNWVIRLIPWRDPDQPRFWCLRVELATGPTMVAPTAQIDPYYVALAMSRQVLTDTIVRIQEDPDTWMAEVAQTDVGAWLADALLLPKPEPPERFPVRPRPERAS